MAMRVYPIYLDAKRSTRQGRRVPVEEACELPHPQQIAAAAQAMGLQVLGVEMDKAHPREAWVRGRVTVNRAQGVSRKNTLIGVARKLKELAEKAGQVLAENKQLDSLQDNANAKKNKKKK
jgi:signal recognition particle subunit SEC65